MVNLRTPGPTPPPPAVREALARDMLNHRGPEFAAILRDCLAGVQWAFQTHHDVVILTSSGTGGLESLVANTLSPGQRLLVASNRWPGLGVLATNDSRPPVPELVKMTTSW